MGRSQESCPTPRLFWAKPCHGTRLELGRRKCCDQLRGKLRNPTDELRVEKRSCPHVEGKLLPIEQAIWRTLCRMFVSSNNEASQERAVDHSLTIQHCTQVLGIGYVLD